MQVHISNRNYDLSSEEAKIVTDYLNRVRNYVRGRSISEELVEDLESSLAEKLDTIVTKKTHSTKDVLSAIKSIGEPEEVFAFEETGTRSKETAPNRAGASLREFFAQPWRRSRNGAILFGVCSGIAKGLGIDPLWIRIAFILLTFAGGFGALFYIVLIFLMDRDPNGGSGNGSSNGISASSNDGGGGLRIGLDRLSEIGIRFFSGIFGLGALGASIGLVTLIGILRGSLVIANVDIGSAIPLFGYYALLAGFAFAFTLAICLLARTFGRRSWSVASLAAILGLFLLSVGLASATVGEGIRQYAAEAMIEKQSSLEGVHNGKYTVRYGANSHFPFSGLDEVQVVTQTGAASGTIIVESKITGRGVTSNMVKGALEHYITLKARVEGDEIILSRPEEKLFDTTSQLVFPHEGITLVVPPGIEAGYPEYSIQQWNEEMDNLEHDIGSDTGETLPASPEVPPLPPSPSVR